jgi:magnesium transporter
VLKALGRKGDLTSKVCESLVSVGRLVLFFANEAEGLRWAKDARLQLKSMQRDVSSLYDHATYLTNKVTFLLNAMLGVVSIRGTTSSRCFRWRPWCSCRRR